MKHIIILLSLMSLTAFAQSQENNPIKSLDFGQKINQYNSQGIKDGLWVEGDDLLRYTFYHNGVCDGLTFTYRPYPLTNTVSILNYFTKGEPKVFMLLGEGGAGVGDGPPGALLLMALCSINSELTTKKYPSLQEYYEIVPYYKAYTKIFYPTGNLQSEGYDVWDRDESYIVDSMESGEWKYYDTEGNVTVKKFTDMPESLINSSDSTFDFGQKINQYNSSGDKEGLWEEDWGPECIAYITYHNGKRNGLFCAYRPLTNTFSQIGEYIAGEPRMVINMGEGDLSHRETPAGRITSFALYSTNKEFSIYTQDGSSFTPYYKRYEKNFYPDGQLESEGFMIWDKDQDPEKDSIKVGEWKYCDADGSITIKNYQKDF